MRKHLTDLETQRLQAKVDAVKKRIVRPGGDKLRRRSARKVTG